MPYVCSVSQRFYVCKVLLLYNIPALASVFLRNNMLDDGPVTCTIIACGMLAQIQQRITLKSACDCVYTGSVELKGISAEC